MGIISLEDSDKMIENMYEIATEKSISDKLKDAEECKARWMFLEHYILQHLDKLDLPRSQYHNLWIRERFFYEMQQRTGLDFGFCDYFIPAFRNRTQSLLEDNLELDLDNKCTYGAKGLIMAICSGTGRDICVHLHSELKQERDRIIEQYTKNLLMRLKAPWN